VIYTSPKAHASLTHLSHIEFDGRARQVTYATLTHYAIHDIDICSMFLPESDVLKPREASLAECDWAEFVLRDASVGHESNGKPANLLLAYADTPLKVQGRLQAPSREHSHYGIICAQPCRRALSLTERCSTQETIQAHRHPCSLCHTVRLRAAD